MRARILDYGQVNSFNVVDISMDTSPAFVVPVTFSQCTVSELQVQTETIKEGTWYFSRKVIIGAEVSSILLSRGLLSYDSDFWRWILSAITGKMKRKNLLLLQYSGYNPLAKYTSTIGLAGAGIGLLGAGVGMAGGSSVGGALSFIGGVTQAAVGIPNKVWYLKGCIPTRYKPGSDMDASDDAISIMELEVEMNYFEEIALTA